MNISITIDDMNFDLELDVKPGYYKPAKLTGDPDSWGESESQEHEFDIESVKIDLENLTLEEFAALDDDEINLHSDSIIKANQLKHNDYSDKERDLILERIDEELELKSKYLMEP